MIAVAVAAVALAGGNPISDPSQLFPGAVATVDRSVGVFPVPGGGVQAVRLATGAKQWTSSAACWPLEILDNEVFAAKPDSSRPNAFELVGLNLEDGSVQFTSEPVNLAPWAKPVFSYDEQPCYRFDLTSEQYDNHTVLVRWCAREWGAAHRKDVGDIQIDIQTGAVAKPFLGARPSVLLKNLLQDKHPDLAEPNSHIVGPTTKTDSYTVYLSEADQSQSDQHPLKVVAIDPDTGKLLWDLPLGTRKCVEP